MITATLLVIATHAQDDINWKREALDVISKLGSSAPARIASLTEDELVVRVNENDWGNLVIVYLEGYPVVSFRQWDRSLSQIHLNPEPIPYSADQYPVAMAEERSFAMAKALRPMYEQWKVEGPWTNPLELKYMCRPIVKGWDTEESITFSFRASDGALKWVSGSILLDYSRPIPKVVPQDRAVAAAWDAFNRYQPFPAARLDKARLILGRPTMSWVLDSPSHEFTPEDFALSKAFKAVPLYLVTISYAHASGVAQVVTVDAESGRAMAIRSVQTLGGEVIKDKVVGKVNDLVVECGSTSMTLSLSADVAPRTTLDIGLSLLPLCIGQDRYAARFDKDDNRVWIADEQQWYCYRASREDADKLAKGIMSGKSFGSK